MESMSRLTVFVLVASLILACSAQSKNSVEGQVDTISPDKLHGVYEFVSESVILTEPKKVDYKRTSPEWEGMWQFQNGHFTRVLMKRRRDAFFNPQKREDFGFESSAGPYELEGKSLRLIQAYTFHPFEVDRSIVMNYHFDGDTLVLTQTLQPYIEDLRKGTIKTVLRRSK
jgi:hypothetical protein